MKNIAPLPIDLQSVIGTENVDFSIIAKRNQPVGKSLSKITFGIVWTVLTSFFVVGLLRPLLRGKEALFRVNGSLKTENWVNTYQKYLFQENPGLTLVVVIFVTLGIGILIWGFYSLFQKGGYFVGTLTRLIHYHDGNINTYDWEQFSGNMKINNRKGDLSMQLRTGKMVGRREASDKYVPDVVYISGVANILQIEKICRIRIKENDPTPTGIYRNQ